MLNTVELVILCNQHQHLVWNMAQWLSQGDSFDINGEQIRFLNNKWSLHWEWWKLGLGQSLILEVEVSQQFDGIGLFFVLIELRDRELLLRKRSSRGCCSLERHDEVVFWKEHVDWLTFAYASLLEFIHNLSTDSIDDVDLKDTGIRAKSGNSKEIWIQILVDQVILDKRSWWIVLMIDLRGSLMHWSDLVDALTFSLGEVELPYFVWSPIIADLVASQSSSFLIDTCEENAFLEHIDILWQFLLWICVNPWPWLLKVFIINSEYKLTLWFSEIDEHELISWPLQLCMIELWPSRSIHKSNRIRKDGNNLVLSGIIFSDIMLSDHDLL